MALAGNPNTGKSTVFNALTGLRQHTGNWPGKTVARAEGTFSCDGQRYRLVDLPGTYSLLATSYDEEIARDFLLFGQPDVTVIVVDATRLHRNLNLVLQVMEITDRVVVCLNLMDEAQRHGITIDHQRLSQELGVPVVCTSARYDEGLTQLVDTVTGVATGEILSQPVRMENWPAELREAIQQLTGDLTAAYPELPNPQWVALRLLDGDERMAQSVLSGELVDMLRRRTILSGASSADRPGTDQTLPEWEELLRLASSLRWQVGPGFHESLVESMFASAASIADLTVQYRRGIAGPSLDQTLDRILTSRWTGFPVMILLLAAVLWLTIAGANYPSAFLSWLLLDTIHPCAHVGSRDDRPAVVVVGHLDRRRLPGHGLGRERDVAAHGHLLPALHLAGRFRLSSPGGLQSGRPVQAGRAHGKQALTMCMGLGCNAAGVIATRVIESPRERLIAIITNNFALCNGRWPTQILLATIFLGALVPSYLAGLVSATAVVLVALCWACC